MRRLALTILATLILASTAWSAIHVPRNRAKILSVNSLVNFADGVTPVLNVTPTNVTCELVRTSDAGGAGVTPTLVINTTLVASGGVGNELILLVGSTVGSYSLELTAAQLATVGQYKLTLSDPDVIAPWFCDIIVDPNTVYDSLYAGAAAGTDTLPVDMTQILNTAIPVETVAGYIATGFGKYYNLAPASQVATQASVNQTGDAYAAGAIPPGTAVTDVLNTSKRFSVSTAFPAIAGAYARGTLVMVQDASDAHWEIGIIEGYTAARVMTLRFPLTFTPVNLDPVRVVPAMWYPLAF